MKVICKECNKEFITKEDMLKESYLGAMKTEVYFNCTHCEKKYLVCINSQITRRLMRKIKLYESTGDKIKLEDARKKLKTEMDKLNGKISSR